ncbi:MAG: hypothetical protein GY694_20935 [Gammaproteobacteria bacterium]|jgi:hypothetical protein|nr:hypothetical protein [Gammaproteobacteria bacterium]MCP4268932.1 hypothetical protein [Candidatus Brocadiaceae bacterium]
MKIKEVKIDGITYTVRSSTNAGLKHAIKEFKKAIKKKKEQDNNNETEGHGV